MAEIEAKLEMLSDAWYAAFARFLAEEIHARRDKVRDVDFTMCEVVTDCPDGGVHAHWFTVKNGETQFGRGAPQHWDSRLTAPYGFAAHIGRTTMADLAAAPPRENPAKIDGRLPDTFPPALTEALWKVHDRLAAIVA